METPPRQRTGSFPRPCRTPLPRALGPCDLERGWSFYFSNEPSAEFGYYGSGFLEAARTLARSFARRRGRRQIDILPVLFLYRHSIELLAKAVLLSGNRLMQQGGRSGRARPFRKFWPLAASSAPVARLHQASLRVRALGVALAQVGHRVLRRRPESHRRARRFGSRLVQLPLSDQYSRRTRHITRPHDRSANDFCGARRSC